MNFVAQPEGGDASGSGSGGRTSTPDDPDSCDVIAEALMFALELATFTPSLSGATAVDRLVRQHKSAGRAFGRAGSFETSKLPGCSHKICRSRWIGAGRGSGHWEGVVDARPRYPNYRHRNGLGRAAMPAPNGLFISLGPLTPLDEAALEVALGFVRPGKGLNNPQRCAAAVYRHVARHGAPRIPGLNIFPELENASLFLDPEESNSICSPTRGQSFRAASSRTPAA